MKWIKTILSAKGVLSGTWISSGCSVLAEIAGHVGFDWVLLDMEHGMGSTGELRQTLQAVGNTACASVVRVGGLDILSIKRALDFGAAGIMVPMVNTAKEAQEVVRAMRYPPGGIRGMTSSSRASDYGLSFPEYFSRANDDLLAICQIETKQGVENAEAIAATDGVEVLFIGPSDLSLDLGHYKEFDHPQFRKSMQHVIRACRNNGKHGGILLADPRDIPRAVDDGFSLIAIGTDISIYRDNLRALRLAIDSIRCPQRTR